MSITEQKARATGLVELGDGYRVHLGYEWTGATVTVVRNDDDFVILHQTKTLRRFTLDRTRKYQPSGLPAGRRRPRGVVSERS